jgi:hypothetical protein
MPQCFLNFGQVTETTMVTGCLFVVEMFGIHGGKWVNLKN